MAAIISENIAQHGIWKALQEMAGVMGRNANRVESMTDDEISTGPVIDAVGIPTYVDDVTQYPDFNLQETGWYIFARIFAKDTVLVTDETTVEGAAYTASAGDDHVCVAVRFDGAAVSQKVTVKWGAYTESFIFKATDLAARNQECRVASKAAEATQGAETATAKAQEASTSATEAGQSATSASESATAAATSASDAAGSATAASQSAEQLSSAVTQVEANTADISNLKQNIKTFAGSPLVASAAAEMTDTTRVYVYVGSETGYTFGNWYYYDGTSWVSGGVYNATAVNTDKTLTQEDQPADAKKTGDEITDLKQDLSEMTTATTEDVGKALKAKTVENGEVTEWEFGEAGGDIADNSVTYDMLQKTHIDFPVTIVNYWYYNGTKRTDAKSIEFELPANTPVAWDFNPNYANAAQIRATFVADSDGQIYYDQPNNDTVRMARDSTTNKYRAVSFQPGKIYLTNAFGGTTYYDEDTVISSLNEPHPTDFLKSGWEGDVMDIDVTSPYRVFCIKGYSSGGALQGFSYQVPTYALPGIGWYKTKQSTIALDENWNFISASGYYPYFYNDGTVAYVQGWGSDKDVAPEYLGDGILSFGGRQVVSKGDALSLNKPVNKSIVCFGDSITAAGYPQKLAELYRCIAINKGESGANSGYIRKMLTGIGNESVTPFDWSANPVEICVIMAGYNDTLQGTISEDIPSTSITDADNDWDSYLALFNASSGAGVTTTGNIGFMIEWLQENHPDVRILVCNYHNNTDSKPDRYSNVDTAVKALCEYYGVKYIDVRRTCGINKKNTYKYTSDGLHPNAAGSELIAKAILREM